MKNYRTLARCLSVRLLRIGVSSVRTGRARVQTGRDALGRRYEERAREHVADEIDLIPEIQLMHDAGAV